MRVKLLVGMAGEQSWSRGDEYPCEAEEAARLIEAGMAEPIGPKVEHAVQPAAPVKRSGGGKA